MPVRMKSSCLVLEACDERMSHGSGYGDVVELSGKHIARADKSRDVACSGNLQPCICALSPPEGKIDKPPATCSMNAPRCLARYHDLEVDQVDDEGLHQLSLDDRACDLKYRLINKKKRPL